MKTTLTLLFAIAFLLYIGNIKIQFSPFTVSMSEWRNTLGLVFLILSLTFFQMHYRMDERKKTLSLVNEVIQDIKNDIDLEKKEH